MGPFLDTHAAPQQVALNIEVELEYWRCCYRRMPFHRHGLAYEAYVPAIKFAYDCYLYHHRDDLKMLFPALKERYQRQFPLQQRTEWRVVERIVKAVWQRIQSGEPCTASRKVAATSPPPRNLEVRKVRNVAHA
jgi:hypothetical protein